MASLTPGQRQIVQRIVRVGRQVGATPKEIKAALETGRVEANFSNPQHATDHDSIGWRQERASLYPNPGDLDASIRRFFRETKAVRDKYGNSGDLAAAVQRPAAQYRGRYAQVSGEAQRLLEQAFSGRIGTTGGGGSAGRVRTIPGRPGSTRTESTTTVIPGVDNRLARASLIQSFLDDHSSIDPLDFAVQARQLQDVAPSSTTETRTFRTPGTPGRTVRADASTAPGGGRGGGSDLASFATQRANALDAKHFAYQWGGGHAGRIGDISKAVPVDCSGAVSAVLGIDPRVSGQFAKWGRPGDGGNRGDQPAVPEGLHRPPLRPLMTATTQKRAHIALAAVWLAAAFPIMLTPSLANSVPLLVFISVYAIVASHVSAAQAARADEHSPDE
jgi:hypothetical protein